MKIIAYSYRYADAVLNDAAFSATYKELIDKLEALEPSLYAPEKVKMRKREKLVRAFPVDQKAMNSVLEKSMPEGWAIRPLVVDRKDGPVTKIRSDFKKDRIQVEVQFGNMARWYTDVFKFQLAYSLGDIDVGILVVPTNRFANLIDENVASYERVLRELPWAKMSLTLPILVVGIEPSDYSAVKERYEEGGRKYSEKAATDYQRLLEEGDATVAEKKRPKALRPFAEALAEEGDIEGELDEAEE